MQAISSTIFDTLCRLSRFALLKSTLITSLIFTTDILHHKITISYYAIANLISNKTKINESQVSFQFVAQIGSKLHNVNENANFTLPKIEGLDSPENDQSFQIDHLII